MSFVLVVNIRIKPESVDAFMKKAGGKRARGAQGAGLQAVRGAGRSRRTRRR